MTANAIAADQSARWQRTEAVHAARRRCRRSAGSRTRGTRSGVRETFGERTQTHVPDPAQTVRHHDDRRAGTSIGLVQPSPAGHSAGGELDVRTLPHHSPTDHHMPNSPYAEQVDGDRTHGTPTLDNHAVLVSGGAGCIGSHTVVQLAGAGLYVVVVDDFSNSNRPSSAGSKPSPARPSRCTVSTSPTRTRPNSSSPPSRSTRSSTSRRIQSRRRSVAKPLDYYQNNLDSTFSLLRAMNAHGVRRLVFSSSATVYGAEPVLPMTEDLPRRRPTRTGGRR